MLAMELLPLLTCLVVDAGPRKRGPKILSLEASAAARDAEDDADYDQEREAEVGTCRVGHFWSSFCQC